MRLIGCIQRPTTDKRQFLLSTPLRIANGIEKLGEDPHGAPNCERVVQDVYLAFESNKKVFEAGDRIVPGLVNRNGYYKNKQGSLQLGVKRVKSYVDGDDTYLGRSSK